jgi:hypothetical protein
MPTELQNDPHPISKDAGNEAVANRVEKTSLDPPFEN